MKEVHPPRFCRISRKVLFPLLIAACAGDCIAGARADESQTNVEWSVVRVGDEIAGEDHWHGFNSAMFKTEDVIMEYAAKPFNRVYSSIVPKPLIHGIDNALDNAEYPVRLCATLFRGECACAWDETKRFVVNSIIGIGGLFDPVMNWFGMFSTEASFSGTFATWGMPKGKSLILPFVLRGNVRDCAGYLLDMGLDPETYVDFFFPTGIWISWTTAFWPNYLAMGMDPWDSAVKQSSDPYAAYRRMIAMKSLLDERYAVYNYLNELVANEDGTRRPPVREPLKRPDGLKGRWMDIADYEPRTPAVDTLRQRLFLPTRSDDFWWMRASIFNGDFANDLVERSASIATNLPSAKYGFVPASVPHRRLVFVIPGIGGAFDDDSTLAMAELLHDAGADVVTLDDPFHPRYIASINKGIAPGDFLEDSRRMAAFMRMVVDDLEKDGLVDYPQVSVVGWSMGGIFTAYLSDLDSRGELGLAVGTMLAVNTPVDFDHAVSVIESYMKPSMSWTREQAIEKFVDVAPRLWVWDDLQFDTTPDISDEDARFVVAATLVAAASPEDFSSHGGLRSLDKTLRGNARLKMIHTRDDFLLNEADRDYLDDALASRITWFSAGAHCGMFYTPEFKQEVLDRLELGN